MNFAQVKGITIPQGAVKQLSQGQTTLWKKRGGVLPADYRELIGIDFDGDFHYETGEKLYGSDVITITLDNTSTTGQNVFGSYNGTASGRKNFSLFVYGNGSSSNSYLRYGESLYRPKYGTGKRTLVFGGNGATDGFATDVNITPDTFVTDVQAFIGWLPNSSSPHYTGDIVGRISVGNRLIWIPVERVSDGEIGYYELNSGVFLTKTGTGTPVSLGYLDNPLPAGAIACDSLYSDGMSAFIPTTFVPLATMSYEADVTYVLPSQSFIIPFGYFINSHRYAPIVLENRRMQVGYNGWYWGSSLLYPLAIQLKVKVVVTPTQTKIDHYNLDGTLYDSQTITYSESSFVPAESIGLLGRRDGASSIYSGSWRGALGKLLCYGDDHFGNLVAEFLPCYYQGNFGFWERVSETFLIGNTPGNIGGFGSHWGTEGFWPNILNDSSHSAKPYLTDDRSYITTRDFAVPAGCTQVQMRVSASTMSGNTAILMCLDSSKTYVDWYSYNAVDRVVSLPSNTAFVRLSIPRSYFGDAWLKDYTNDQYIWKGQNVI